DLLRQDVEWRLWDHQPIEISLTDGPHQCRAFHQFIAGHGEQPAFGNGAAPVAGTPDPLQRDGDSARRTQLANQVDATDVNPKLERCRRNQYFDFSVLQFSFGREAQLARKAAMMGGYCFVPQSLGQIVGDPFRQATRIDEYQSRPVLPN